MSPRGRWGTPVTLLLGLLGAGIVQHAFAAEKAASARMAPPGFAGTWVWLPPRTPDNVVLPPVLGSGPPPGLVAQLSLFRPEIAAKMMRNAPRPNAPGAAAGPPVDRGYCGGMLPFTGGTGFAVTPGGTVSAAFEMLLSPGQVTILDEMSRIRRLFLRDSPPPDSLDESNSGLSLARSEGQTLVVQTSRLNPAALAIIGIRGTELGRNAQVMERMRLVEPDVLEIVATITAPDLFAAPVTTTNRYRRDPEKTLIEMAVCVENDRAYDHATKMERFDATPPADLPPPPPG